VTAPRLVSAGAGSGKTHRIVEEVVARVRDGVSVERIAAVTFTEAAASELQERLRLRLLDEGLRDEAARVEGAMICTIHRFALTLLTRFSARGGGGADAHGARRRRRPRPARARDGA
jgi:ATP-dependent helicase/nuclease subunit A